MKMRMVPIGECARIVNGFAFKSELFNTRRTGLPVVRIRDVVLGRSKTFYTGEYPQTAVVLNGDLLIGMDGEFNIAHWRGGTALLNQRVCKIEPREGVADISYLRHAIAIALKRIENRTPFVTVKHLSSEELKEESIPLPSFSEQQRIAGLLEEADWLRRTRRYALELSDTFLQSVFLQMFGDPVNNPKGYEYQTIENLCDLVRGSSPRPQGDPKFFGGPIPRLMIADITRDGIYVTPKIDSLTEEGALRSRPMKTGSVVMAVSGAVGLAAILKVDACIHDGFVGFRNLSDRVLPIYFVTLLGFLRIRNSQQAAGAIWKNLTSDQVQAWRVVVSPLKLQQKFTEIVTRFENLRAQQREAERQAEHLFQTLLHRVFACGLQDASSDTCSNSKD